MRPSASAPAPAAAALPASCAVQDTSGSGCARFRRSGSQNSSHFDKSQEHTEQGCAVLVRSLAPASATLSTCGQVGACSLWRLLAHGAHKHVAVAKGEIRRLACPAQATDPQASDQTPLHLTVQTHRRVQHTQDMSIEITSVPGFHATPHQQWPASTRPWQPCCTAFCAT